MHLVLWGDNARDPPAEGDTISLFNVSCKTDRRGDREIQVSWGCLLINDSDPKSEKVSISGMIIETARGTCIDDGQECLLIDMSLPPGTEYYVEGVKTGDKLSIVSYSEFTRSADELNERIRFINE
jgi:hypothetical protein